MGAAFEAPTKSYIISFDGSSFSADSEIMGILSEVVLVAKNRAIVKLASGAAYAELEAKVKHYNSMNVENKFRRIHNSDREQLWCETREPASAPELRRAKGIPHPSPSDIILRMDADTAVLKEAATAFVAGAQAHLAGKGYHFARRIQVHPQFAPGMDISRTILIFLSTETARVFFYTFRDYVWTNDSGTQRITVQLYNHHFQTELQERQLRTMAARGLLPIEATQISQSGGAAALALQ